jgi:cobalt-zinc-cadmium efflux system outer membrane protein
MRVALYVCTAALLALVPSVAGAQPSPVRLTLDAVLASVRVQSPDVLIANARIDEARARLVGARARFRQNPTVDFSAGPRRSGGATSADLDIGFTQSFETGGQRAARVRAAEASITMEAATAADVRRQALQTAALAFIDLAYAEQRLRLLRTAEEIASETLRIATQRFDAGDIARLDVNLATSARARAQSARIGAETDARLASARLVRAAGLPVDAAVSADASLDADRSIDPDRLRSALEQRPDLRALQASIEEALAAVRLGEALRRPDLGATIVTKREGGDRALVAGFTVTLPTYVAGQEERAAGTAAAARLRLALNATRAAALQEVESLYQAYLSRREAAAALENDALPSALANERLSQRSFQEGELSLADLIVVRRESVETQLEYLERLREAAETAALRDAAAGVLQ